jgi:hypothetical protein
VIGYHGTRRSTALGIVQGLERRKGHGWPEELAVLGSMIRLGNCFDLLDPDNLQMLTGYHREFEQLERQAGRQPRKNYNQAQYLDGAVFELAYATLESQGEPVDTCRAVFVPSSQRLWSPRAAFTATRMFNCAFGTRSVYWELGW